VALGAAPGEKTEEAYCGGCQTPSCPSRSGAGRWRAPVAMPSDARCGRRSPARSQGQTPHGCAAVRVGTRCQGQTLPPVGVGYRGTSPPPGVLRAQWDLPAGSCATPGVAGGPWPGFPTRQGLCGPRRGGRRRAGRSNGRTPHAPTRGSRGPCRAVRHRRATAVAGRGVDRGAGGLWGPTRPPVMPSPPPGAVAASRSVVAVPAGVGGCRPRRGAEGGPRCGVAVARSGPADGRRGWRRDAVLIRPLTTHWSRRQQPSLVPRCGCWRGSPRALGASSPQIPFA
jgi:hypothetical protein